MSSGTTSSLSPLPPLRPRCFGEKWLEKHHQRAKCCGNIVGTERAGGASDKRDTQKQKTLLD